MRHRRWIRSIAIRILALLAPAVALAQGGPAQEPFPPKGGKGPAVVVISGQSGTPSYRHYAKQVADLGYYAVLIDGKDILTRQQDGAANLRKAIADAQASPSGAPGKVMVIGFSQGGGGVLAHAIAMPELVAAAVVYYPATSWARSLPGVIGRLQMPLLLLAAERDRYNNCCLIEHMREMESTAKARGLPLELVVYPDADHGFNLDGRQYRGGDTTDAWRRTMEMLAKHLPLNPLK